MLLKSKLNKTVTVKRLRESLSYNPCTGEFRWKTLNKIDKAGCINKQGYTVIRIDHVLFLASRLAWLYIYGRWPDEIDHIDRQRNNNSIWNLRSVSHIENCKNR